MSIDELLVKVHKVGGLLSGMVMPNIGAFITWGLITALFIPTGWIPNENIAIVVEPMLRYLLPLMIAYTGGENVYGKRGGVIGAAATMGVIAGVDIAMFLGAMIMGPFAAYCLKKLDERIKPHIIPGFEMITNNFSMGILGIFLVLLGLFTVGPIISTISSILAGGVDFMIERNLIPLISVFIEPGKVLFLNNAINHGILAPIGINQVEQQGRSLLFLLETNPGPGLGVLLAYSVFGTGMAKSTAPGVAVIHALGGIHESYFPYILMKPILIIAAILGEMAGDFVFLLTDAGLVSTASPGSVFAILAVTPKACLISVFSGILISTLVSFVVGSIILKFSKSEQDSVAIPSHSPEKFFSTAHPPTPVSKNFSTSSLRFFIGSTPIDLGTAKIHKIYFACDAGAGSSVMATTMLNNKAQSAGLDIEADHIAISKLSQQAVDTDIIITHESMTQYAAKESPNSIHISVNNFANVERFDEIIAALKKNAETSKAAQIKSKSNDMQFHESAGILRKKNIILNLPSTSKEEVIKRIGQIMEDGGYTTGEYTKAMLEKEKIFNTAIGNKLAIPHGIATMRREILSSGIVILTYPEGIDWSNGQIVNLVIGIASSGEEHIRILRKLAILLETTETVNRVLKMNVDEIYNMFS